MTPELPSATSEASNPTTVDLVRIRNCNSISEAVISIRRNSLNIKFGPNGVGKSTIARALALHAEGGDALLELTPFRFRNHSDEDDTPKVSDANELKSVLVFDEDYVSQFVFQHDEVMKNSFEIFINTPEYQAGIEQIENIFAQLKDLFVENPVLDSVIESFTELRNAFTVTKTGGISKTSRGYKALGMSGKLTEIPEQLAGFKDFLTGVDAAGWITWQSKGKAYLSSSDNCPFCSTSKVNKDVATQVSDEYESSAVKNLVALRTTVSKLRSFFAPEYLTKLEAIIGTLNDLSPEQTQFLANLRGQVETLLGKFTALKQLSFHVLREVPDVDHALSKLTIDLTLLEALNSEDTRYVVDNMNEQLTDVAAEISEIKAQVGMQRTRVAKSIRENQDDINDFLSSAGYKYMVRIEPNEDSYRMILEHRDAPGGHLDSAARHLSYGERNAFALVLFMHHVRRDDPNLVVLDDPVSSFDKTKKFAILHKLFHGKASLRNFTTLLLTHDIEPAIDIVRTSTAGQFTAAAPVVHFLRESNGHLTEEIITREDIQTFSQVCNENIQLASDDVIKCIYLRRLYEVHGKLSLEYDVLSSLLHLRQAPCRKDPAGDLTPVESAELSSAVASIRETIPTFDYDALVTGLSDIDTLRAKFAATEVGYEKVQLFRIASTLLPETNSADAAFRKFVNETYHIENEYVMQLNPRKFDAVPQHVVETCAELLK